MFFIEIDSNLFYPESSGLKRLRAAILKRFRYRVGPGVNIRAAYGSQQGGIEAENTAKRM